MRCCQGVSCSKIWNSFNFWVPGLHTTSLLLAVCVFTGWLITSLSVVRVHCLPLLISECLTILNCLYWKYWKISIKCNTEWCYWSVYLPAYIHFFPRELTFSSRWDSHQTELIAVGVSTWQRFPVIDLQFTQTLQICLGQKNSVKRNLNVRRNRNSLQLSSIWSKHHRKLEIPLTCVVWQRAISYRMFRLLQVMAVCISGIF